MPNWLIGVLVVVTFTVVFGGVLWIVMSWLPADEGVPPPHLPPKQNAALREAALRRISERQNHQQRQRDASARLTRGF